jgi:hypothetical protein
MTSPAASVDGFPGRAGCHSRKASGTLARGHQANLANCNLVWQIAMFSARDKIVTISQTISSSQVGKTQYSWHELCWLNGAPLREFLATRKREWRFL